MKASTIIAIAVSVGVLLIAFVQASIFVAGGIGPNKMPSLGPSAGILDDFLATPMVFLVIGLIYGLIAAARNTLKLTLVVATITGTVLSFGLVYGTRSLQDYVQQLVWRSGQNLPFTITGPPQNSWHTIAIGLWICWYIMGAAIGYRIRNRVRPATS